MDANAGESALHIAVFKGHTAVVEALLEGGVDVNLQDKKFGAVVSTSVLLLWRACF